MSNFFDENNIKNVFDLIAKRKVHIYDLIIKKYKFVSILLKSEPGKKGVIKIVVSPSSNLPNSSYLENKKKTKRGDYNFTYDEEGHVSSL